MACVFRIVLIVYSVTFICQEMSKPSNCIWNDKTGTVWPKTKGIAEGNCDQRGNIKEWKMNLKKQHRIKPHNLFTLGQ